MAVYWLTPVDQEDPLTFGADRLRLESGAELEVFRDKLYRIHPRFLPMVKASILPADTDEEQEEQSMACGHSGQEPDFGNPVPIVFDGISYGLSHCGRAFADRLPGAREQLAWLNQASSMPGVEWSQREQAWLALMRQWAISGRQALLVKED